ncbi:MAG TPA: hypothetical protein VEY67_03260, partial [Candidatus Dormibacteraeota bacterium]|nr:hypothetical protein [Candidatus Dormibacteraeota bacterium]
MLSGGREEAELGPGGSLLAVVRRARSDGPLLVTAWALLVAAMALVAATATLSDAVSLGALRRAVDAAPLADRIVTVALTAAPSDAPGLATRVRPVLDATLAGSGSTVPVTRAGGLVIAGHSGGTLLASFEDIEAHASLVRGAWPVGGRHAVEAVLSEGAARTLGLAIGDRTTVADSLDPSRAMGLVIVGVYRPDAADEYWAGSTLETTGTERRGDIVTAGPLVVAPADLLASAPRDVELSWRLLPRIASLGVADVPVLRAAIASLPDRLGAVLPSAARPSVSTGLPEILGGLERSLLVTRAGVVLLALQFGILAGYAIVLVAAVLVERRRDHLTMLRARGAGTGFVVATALAEGVLLVVPAAVVAPFAAVAAVDALGSVGPLGGSMAPATVGVTTLLATAATAGVCLAALIVPTIASVVSTEGLRLGRSGTTTLPQRLGLDLVLLALAGLGLWQLGAYGAPLTRGLRGTLGIDPLLVAA